MIIKERSSRVIVRHENGNLLLVYNTKFNVWEFPGGSLEVGENHYQAAIRELEEETGLSTKAKLLNEITNAQYISRVGNWHEVKVYWTSRMAVWGDMTDPSRDKNIREVGWMNPEQFLTINMHPFSQFAATLIPQAVEARHDTQVNSIEAEAENKLFGRKW